MIKCFVDAKNDENVTIQFKVYTKIYRTKASEWRIFYSNINSFSLPFMESSIVVLTSVTTYLHMGIKIKN